MTTNLKGLTAAVVLAIADAPAWAIPFGPDGNIADFSSNGFTLSGGQLISDTSNILASAEVTYLTTSALVGGYSNPLTVTLDAAPTDPLRLVVWNRASFPATIEGTSFNSNGPKVILPTMVNATTYTVGTADLSFEFGITGYRFGSTPLQYFEAPATPGPGSGNAVPEPATAGLLLLGLAAVGLLARRRLLA